MELKGLNDDRTETSECAEKERNVERSDDHLESLSIAVTRKASFSRVLARHSVAWAQYSLRRLPIKMTLGNVGALVVVLAILLPRSFTYILVYPIFRLVFGTLYPAYASYKAVRTRNVKEYVKWMMYWIVFALFTCAETFTDVFFSFWFPFYYEIKIILVLWLLSPATKGSSILYRRFVHPALIRREAEIDEAIARATEQGYTAVLHLGTKGVNYATTVLMQTAIKGGGGLVQQLRKSYSLSDLTGEKETENRNSADSRDEIDMEVEPRRREHVGRRGYSPRRTQSSSNRVEMYFSEVDVDVRQPRPREPSLTNIRSSDDISSGYSSGEALQSHRTTSQGDSLVRTSSVGARTRAKPRSTTKKTPEDAGESVDCTDVPTFENVSFPPSLSFLTPDQVFHILSFLSQNNPVNPIDTTQKSENSEEKDTLIQSADFGKVIESITTVEKYEPPILEPETGITNPDVDTESKQMKVEKFPNNPLTSVESDTTDSVKITETSKPVAQEREDTFEKQELSISTIEKSDTEIDQQRITEEMCQDKFNELKELLDNAHKAVTNIVSSQEKLHKSNEAINDEAINNEVLLQPDSDNNNDRKSSSDSINNTSSIETWATPSISRSSSDSAGRAGKYNKKPAPKAPTTKGEEDLEETESQNALKATLVIKTGMVKTFANVSTTKDVFVAHAPESKSKRRKSRSRTKEGFSKLLTIPKNIFHSAFHKDQKNSCKEDDPNGSLVSEVGSSRSRSESVESQDVFVDVATKLSDLNHEANVDKSSNSEKEKIKVLVENDKDPKEKEPTENNVENKNDTKLNTEIITDSQIRQVSQSVSSGSKIVTDID